MSSEYNDVLHDIGLGFDFGITYTVVTHIHTYDHAQNILNFVQPLQNLIL